MNFRDLEYVIAVAKYESFHRAAEQCYVSQPALSMQIKKLEQELDLQLFERHKKSVLVTSAGRAIVAKAEQILLLKEDFYNLVHLNKNPFNTRIRLGVFPTLAQYFIPEFLPDIHQQYPDLKIIPVEQTSELLIEQLESGLLEAALLALPVDRPDLVKRELFQDRFLVAVHKQHPLANRQNIAIKDITSEQMLILQQGHCLRDQIIALSDDLKFDDTATSLETLRQMVQINLGITIIPAIAVHNQYYTHSKQIHGDDSIRYVKFRQPEPFRRIALVYRKSSPFEQVYDALERLLVAAHQRTLTTVA